MVVLNKSILCFNKLVNVVFCGAFCVWARFIEKQNGFNKSVDFKMVSKWFPWISKWFQNGFRGFQNGFKHKMVSKWFPWMTMSPLLSWGNAALRPSSSSGGQLQPSGWA
jgi:hypothetical protein